MWRVRQAGQRLRKFPMTGHQFHRNLAIPNLPGSSLTKVIVTGTLALFGVLTWAVKEIQEWREFRRKLKQLRLPAVQVPEVPGILKDEEEELEPAFRDLLQLSDAIRALPDLLLHSSSLERVTALLAKVGKVLDPSSPLASSPVDVMELASEVLRHFEETLRSPTVRAFAAQHLDRIPLPELILLCCDAAVPAELRAKAATCLNTMSHADKLLRRAVELGGVRLQVALAQYGDVQQDLLQPELLPGYRRLFPVQTLSSGSSCRPSSLDGVAAARRLLDFLLSLHPLPDPPKASSKAAKSAASSSSSSSAAAKELSRKERQALLSSLPGYAHAPGICRSWLNSDDSEGTPAEVMAAVVHYLNEASKTQPEIKAGLHYLLIRTLANHLQHPEFAARFLSATFPSPSPPSGEKGENAGAGEIDGLSLLYALSSAHEHEIRVKVQTARCLANLCSHSPLLAALAVASQQKEQLQDTGDFTAALNSPNPPSSQVNFDAQEAVERVVRAGFLPLLYDFARRPWAHRSSDRKRRDLLAAAPSPTAALQQQQEQRGTSKASKQTAAAPSADTAPAAAAPILPPSPPPPSPSHAEGMSEERTMLEVTLPPTDDTGKKGSTAAAQQQQQHGQHAKTQECPSPSSSSSSSSYWGLDADVIRALREAVAGTFETAQTAAVKTWNWAASSVSSVVYGPAASSSSSSSFASTPAAAAAAFRQSLAPSGKGKEVDNTGTEQGKDKDGTAAAAREEEKEAPGKDKLPILEQLIANLEDLDLPPASSKRDALDATLRNKLQCEAVRALVNMAAVCEDTLQLQRLILLLSSSSSSPPDLTSIFTSPPSLSLFSSAYPLSALSLSRLPFQKRPQYGDQLYLLYPILPPMDPQQAALATAAEQQLLERGGSTQEQQQVQEQDAEKKQQQQQQQKKRKQGKEKSKKEREPSSSSTTAAVVVEETALQQLQQQRPPATTVKEAVDLVNRLWQQHRGFYPERKEEEEEKAHEPHKKEEGKVDAVCRSTVKAAALLVDDISVVAEEEGREEDEEQEEDRVVADLVSFTQQHQQQQQRQQQSSNVPLPSAPAISPEEVPSRLQRRPKKHQYVDVIFVHGLLGSALRTWRLHTEVANSNGHFVEREVCWPKDWLPHDLLKALQEAEGASDTQFTLRILTVGYPTVNMPGAQPLHSRSMSWLVKLQHACVGGSGGATVRRQPRRRKSATSSAEGNSSKEFKVVWVTHSMGGLLAKQMLVDAWRGGPSSPFYPLFANTAAVVFYGTPHLGAAWPFWLIRPLYPATSEMRELTDWDKLKELNEAVRSFLRPRPDGSPGIRFLSFGEGLPTFIPAVQRSLMIVPPQDANPGYGTFVAANTDHLNVCKPRDRSDIIYTRLVDFIRSVTVPSQATAKAAHIA